MKLKFIDPLNKDKMIIFTVTSYGYDAEKEVYYFNDKFGTPLEWAKKYFIGTEGDTPEQ